MSQGEALIDFDRFFEVFAALCKALRRTAFSYRILAELVLLSRGQAFRRQFIQIAGFIVR